MKAARANTVKGVSVKQTAGNKINPFKKLMDDKQRIVEAIRDGRDLSTLKVYGYSSYSLPAFHNT